MTRIKLSVLIAWVSIIWAQPSWEIVRFVPWRGVDPFYDVCFLPGTQTGWAVGCAYRDTNFAYYGAVAHTTDGGRTWVPQMATGKAIYFVDENHGWTAGGSGTIYHTTDGGQTWTIQTTPITQALYAISFIDTLMGWAFGLYGYVLHTTDAGNTWEIQYQFSDKYGCMDGVFKDSLNGWVCGYDTIDGKIYKTTNGGNTWNVLSPGTNFNFYGIDFYDLNLGWAVTSGWGIVTATTDGGNSWSAQQIEGFSFLDVKFADASSGWIVGGEIDGLSAIYNSTNGGATWQEQNNPTYNELWGVAASSRSDAWAVGRYGTILHTSDGGNNWEYQAGGASNNLINIDAPDTLHIWAVGDWERTVLHSSDGGLTWEHQMVGDGYGYLWDVSFADSFNGATVGGFDLIYTTTDGGQNWTRRSTGGDFAWWGVEWISPLKGWIVDVNSGVIKYTADGGNTWTTQYSGIYFTDVMFLNDTLGWACGFTFSNSKVAKTTNGQTWTSCTLPTQRILNGIDFVSPNLGWVVGENGEIYKSTDGGITWDSLHNDTLGTADLYKVDFVDSLNGWIISGHERKIFRTRDGGNTWVTDRVLPLHAGGGSNFRGLVALDTLHSWACMSDGIILRYGTTTHIKEETKVQKPRAESPKMEIYPNPFHNKTTIKFEIRNPKSEMSLRIYDASGRLVRQWDYETIRQSDKIIWDGSDDAGHQVSAGVYFVRLESEDYKQVEKILLLH